MPADTAISYFEDEEIDSNLFTRLVDAAQDLPLEEKMRIYAGAAQAATGEIRELLEKKSLRCIRDLIEEGTNGDIFFNSNLEIRKDKCCVMLPLRVNWCGTWSDTPPYCIENGGAVVNAAVNINNISPVKVYIEKLDQPKFILEYFDSGDRGEFHKADELSDLVNPLEPFPLLKAALIVCGIVPLPGKNLNGDIFKKLSGGIYLSTGVSGIPKGSGLGTSSILLAACIKALFEFTGRKITDAEICRRVLLAEQLMGTGGGWQDQAGGLTNGIKLATSAPGRRQEVVVKQLNAPETFLDEINQRFCLVYSGKRRLGRTILREMMSGYLKSDPKFVKTFEQIHSLAEEMSTSIESGNMERFIETFNMQTKLTMSLDTGYINERLIQIFNACDDMTAGKMICGAGGGGFIQIVLKDGYSGQDLCARLRASFPGQGIDVWQCNFVL